jgi:hypothetical protein
VPSLPRPPLGIGDEEDGRFALRGGVHPLEPSVAVVDRGGLGDLIEDGVDLRHLADGAVVEERVVEREGGVAADLAEERELFVGPLPVGVAHVQPERPRLFFARPEDLDHGRADLEAFGELRVELGVAHGDGDRARRLESAADQGLRAGEQDRAFVAEVAFAAFGGDGERDFGELRLFVDGMEQPGAVGAEFLAGDGDDAAQHFAQLERGGEGLEDVRQKPVPLLGGEPDALRRGRREVADHQTADRRVVGEQLGKLEDPRHRLLALGRVAYVLPG